MKSNEIQFEDIEEEFKKLIENDPALKEMEEGVENSKFEFNKFMFLKSKDEKQKLFIQNDLLSNQLENLRLQNSYLEDHFKLLERELSSVQNFIHKKLGKDGLQEYIAERKEFLNFQILSNENKILEDLRNENSKTPADKNIPTTHQDNIVAVKNDLIDHKNNGVANNNAANNE